jgi:hypothetical protein
MYRSFVLGFLMVSSTAMGAEKTVWQIGKPDHDYSEFAFAGNYQQCAKHFGAKPIVFEVGRSDPARDWPFIQPGTTDAWSPLGGKPSTIRFTLGEPPRGAYALRVEFVDTQGGVPPRYVVAVGGRTCGFQLARGGGDASLTDPRAGKPLRVELALPARLFKRGTNEIQLTCTDGSWVQYDAITLLQDPERELVPEVRTLTVRPTPLLARRKGRLCRLVDVVVEATAPGDELSLRVEGAGAPVEATFHQLPLAGPIAREFALPDTSEPMDLEVTAVLDSHAKTAKVRVLPQRKWLIFVAPSAHTDIGYTDVQPKCAERHCENIDRAIELCRHFPGFHWNLEVAWQAENYVQSRKGPLLADFYRFAREGRLGVQALYCNMLTGLCSHEELCRLTWFAHQLCHGKGISFRSAMISDVPSQEAAMPTILAGAGIRYFSSGSNRDHSYPFNHLFGSRPFWWEGPDGSRVLTLYVENYAYASRWALDASLEAARARVTEELAGYEKRTDYPYDAVFLHGAVSDNCPLKAELASVVQEWNRRYEFPKIILSHNAEFFGYIEKRYGDKLPVFRGSGGAYWEDGAGSSARETSYCRNAHEKAANGEKLLALAERIGRLKAYRPDAIYKVWRNCMLYDEHTWGAYCSVDQPESDFTKAQWKIKAQFAVDAAKGARRLVQQGAKALASLVRTEGPALVVFNPTSWPRTDVLHVTLPDGMAVADPDATSYRTPEFTFVLVKDVPPCGYRVLGLGPRHTPSVAEPTEGNVVESRYYRVEFDPASGGIASIRDKDLGRELVDRKTPFRANQYVYVTGYNQRLIIDPTAPLPALKLTGSGRAKLQRIRYPGVCDTMRVVTSGPMTPRIESTIVVWDGLKRIDIKNNLTKKLTYEREGVYFAFPFAATRPVFRFEAPAAIVNPEKDMLLGGCRDWFSVQHFVEIEGRDATIAWATPDAPLACFQDIDRGKWLTELPMFTGHLYSYVMNNYWHTNYLAGQGGDFAFRYAITSRPKADSVASARFGWAVSNPLVGLPVTAHPQGPLPERPTSLISVAEPNVIVTGVKLADDGPDLIVRLWELTGKPTTAHLRLDRHIPLAKAQGCNLVEESGGPLEIHDGEIAVPIRASGLATVRVQ